MKTNQSQNFMLIAAVTVATSFAAPQAMSQQTTEVDQESRVRLEAIIVTARKRDEALLEVPLTITVITANDIEEKSLLELRDIVDYTPGFYFGGPSGGNNDRSSRRLLLRGMQVNTDVQTRQGAMVFIDGAPVLGAEIGGIESAERIETIKGPQSAYFGRSTFGGAINLITRDPSLDRWHARLNAGVGSYNAFDNGAQVEGPIIEDKLAVRFSVSSKGSDGHWRNAAGGESLGDRETTDFAVTLLARPTEQTSAKLRMHYWEDDDGPSASFAYGPLNGEEVFNCNKGGISGGYPIIQITPTVIGTPTGPNWICGQPRFPRPSEINADLAMTTDLLSVIRGDGAVCPGCYNLNGNNFLTYYGLYREAYELSLDLQHEFANGISLSSLTASHSNESARIDDFDRKATAYLGVKFNTIGVAHRDLSDFSQEFRVTSPDTQRLRWLLGATYSEIEQVTGGTNRNRQGLWLPPVAGLPLNHVETAGLFGAVAFDITEKVSINVEGRYQEDEVTDGSKSFTRPDGVVVPAGTTLTGTFNSFTPRVILDFKPTSDIMLYAIFAQGTRPGEFNAQLISPLIDDEVLACIGQYIYNGIEIPEEDLDNYELGIKGQFLDGRLTTTTAVYYAQWRNQHNRGETSLCTDVNGVQRNFQSTGLGGSSDLDGVEIEARFAATDNLSLEGTFSYNHTDILVRDCADCLRILGERELRGLHKEFSRYPELSGTLSGMYQRPLANDNAWFSRLDYIYTGNQYATEANLAETGAAHKLNLRVGVIMSNGLRVEVYGTNLLDDMTFQGYQRFDDAAFVGYNLLTAGLPNKATYGVRASYSFNLARGD